jgi:hypothetical protein
MDRIMRCSLFSPGNSSLFRCGQCRSIASFMATDDADKQKLAKLESDFTQHKGEFAALKKGVSEFPRGLDKEMWENRRVRFEDSGDWARHYSAVRMTVTTFLVGLSLGIVSFKWEKGDPRPGAIFVALAALVWISAVVLFIAFTRLTYHEMARARKLKLPDTPDDKRTPLHPRWDPASWVLIVVTAIFGLLLCWICNGSLWPPSWAGQDDRIYHYAPVAIMLFAVVGLIDRIIASEIDPKKSSGDDLPLSGLSEETR